MLGRIIVFVVGTIGFCTGVYMAVAPVGRILATVVGLVVAVASMLLIVIAVEKKK